MANPVATDDLTYELLEDAYLKTTPAVSVLKNDTDADSDVLAARLVAAPYDPLFMFKTNGTFTYDARYHDTLYVDGAGTLTSFATKQYTLTDGFDSLAAGAVVYDHFTYVANDGQSDSNVATVTVKITGVNDAPIAEDDAKTIGSGATTEVNALGNDHDVDIYPVADTLVITGLADKADNGGPAGTSDTDADNIVSITTDAGGTVTLVSGKLQYTAAAGFFGIDTFEYTVNDGHGGVDTGLVRMTVVPGNAAPTADDDVYNVGENDPEKVMASVLSNDTDPDGDELAAKLNVAIGSALRRVDANGNTIAGATGILVDFNSDGTFSYNPNGAFNSLAAGEKAWVAFDYTAYDGLGASDTAKVTIEITGANDTPSGEAPPLSEVYEAGLANGSGDGTTTIVQDINITMTDPDGDLLTVVNEDGDTLELNGAYGKLEFVDADTVRYTLQNAADHSAVQGHNGAIFENFSVYAKDSSGALSSAISVRVEVFDDINFLVTRPNNAAPQSGDTIDNKTVAFIANETVSDSFYLNGGADGQVLDIVGIPKNFTLVDGRVIQSKIVSVGGVEHVEGYYTDTSGSHTFYTLFLNADAANDIGSYTLKMFENAPAVIHPLDFSAVKAGGPKETLTVSSVTFDGGTFTAGSSLKTSFTNSATSSDDINPNNAGGIGIGNGNIDRLEVLSIAVPGNVTGLQFEVQGVGGGIGTGDIIWEAWSGNSLVQSSQVKDVPLGGSGAVTVTIDPTLAFDRLYVALDPADFDSNDTMRINKIATIEQVNSNGIKLDFAVNSDDGDGDHAPAETANPSYVPFVVTVQGSSGITNDPGMLIV